MINVRWAATSHVGGVRSVNQDAMLTGPSVFAIADGMGGHAAGEVASAIAITALSTLESPVSEESLAAAISAANARVISESTQGSGREGMGTTLVGMAIVTADAGDEVVVFNVGDSRAYRFAHGELQQVSQDHSVVAEMIRDGVLTQVEAMGHPSRNIITRVIGDESDLHVDLWRFDPAAGERFLLCSDGLTNEVDDVALLDALLANEEPQPVVDRMLAEALAAGGKDNISIVLVDIDSVVARDTSIDDDTNPRMRSEPASRSQR